MSQWSPPVLFRVADVETTGLDPAIDRVVEIGVVDVVDGALRAGRSSYINPEQAIPPEASAAHHIVDADVADAPRIEEAGPHLLLAGGAPDYFVAHNAAFDCKWLACFIGAIPVICTMKAALRVWPEAKTFSNRSLQYWLGLGELGARAVPPHRALPDAFVTAHILGRLLQEASPEEMAAWTLEPAVLPRITFGKHQGDRWSDLPLDYLDWMADPQKSPNLDEDARWNARREIQRRVELERIAEVARARAEIPKQLTYGDLKAWFFAKRPGWDRLGIVEGSQHYDAIVADCTARRDEIAASVASITASLTASPEPRSSPADAGKGAIHG